MCVTSWPRRTDSVNAPGDEDERRARKEPSKPRVSSSASASWPLIDGWNHLHHERNSEWRDFNLYILIYTTTLCNYYETMRL